MLHDVGIRLQGYGPKQPAVHPKQPAVARGPCPDCALEDALRHSEEQGAEYAADRASPGGILAALVQCPEHRPRILWRLCDALWGALSGPRGAEWRRVLSALHVLDELTEASPEAVVELQRSASWLPGLLDGVVTSKHPTSDERVTMLLQEKAVHLRQSLTSQAQRVLPTTDPLVAGLVRPHRDDSSTDSGSDAPMPDQEESNNAWETPRPPDGSLCKFHEQQDAAVTGLGKSQQICFGPWQHSSGCLPACGYSARGTADPRQVVAGACCPGGRGCQRCNSSPVSASCITTLAASWTKAAGMGMCAVLPADSGSESEGENSEGSDAGNRDPEQRSAASLSTASQMNPSHGGDFREHVAQEVELSSAASLSNEVKSDSNLTNRS